MEKFCDYLLGSKFHVYTDNSPLAYVRESKLGASQIWWLSELALFDFTIHYRTGRCNRAATALSRHPCTKEGIDKERGSDCDEAEVISYSSACEVVDEYLNTTKVPDDLKKEAQSISHAIQLIMEEEDVKEIQGMLNSVSVLNQVTPLVHGRRAEARFYPWISLSICYSYRKIKNISHLQDQV